MTAQLAKTRLSAILPCDKIERNLEELAEMCRDALNRWATDFPGSLTEVAP